MVNGLKCHPTVCAVNNDYQIMILPETDMLISVKVGDNIYYNHNNGIRVSSACVQRVIVPSKELDKHKKYSVLCRKMLERKPYRSVTEDEYELEYNFRPLEKTENINIYHLADVHGAEKEAIGAAKFLNIDYDLLVLNGDLSSHSDSVDAVTIVYRLASDITKGEIPCVVSRGNHDLRGKYAENLHEFMPGDNGKSYYTFKIGCIWGILVDTGEDKPDDNIEYGNTICCSNFRVEQEKMIKQVIANAEKEYEQEDVKYKIVVSHVPFPFKFEPPFDIEEEMYTKWCRLLEDNIKPDLMLCGHLHKTFVSEKGSEHDAYGQPCTIVLGSDMQLADDWTATFTGMYMNLSKGNAKITFNTNTEVTGKEEITF